MTASFSVRVDPERDLAEMNLSGFFTPDTFAAFNALRDAEFAKFRCAPNQHVTLVDLREMKIQSQEAITLFGGMLANPRYHSRRLAFVVTASLARLQLLRIAEGRAIRLFTDRAEAVAWVTAPLAAAA